MSDTKKKAEKSLAYHLISFHEGPSKGVLKTLTLTTNRRLILIPLKVIMKPPDSKQASSNPVGTQMRKCWNF